MVLESRLVREVEGHYELTGSLPPLAIPTTLQDSLMARLDRLATVKEVAQLGATLGREFSYELLQAVWPTDETDLQQALTKLVDAEVLYQRGLPPQAQYIFKHALIQDAAYQSLLKSRRQQYHQQIAHALEEWFPETKEIQAELLAHHYTEAGLIPQAIFYWQRAGERASRVSACIEAIHHFTRGLELLQALPDTPARHQQELMLQNLLGDSLMVAKGWAAPEVERVYRRALELCRQGEETSQLFFALEGLFAFYLVRAELRTAHELGDRCLKLAQRLQDPETLVWAHHTLGETVFYLGEFALAREHFAQGIALYDPRQHTPYVILVQQDPGVVHLSWAAQTLWFLGYPEQARKRIHEALTLAEELSHPFSLAYVLAMVAELHQFCRESQLAQERAEALIALSTEKGFPARAAQGAILRGWAVAMQGQGEEGILQMWQGSTAWQVAGAKIGRSHQLALLAEAYEKVGQAEDGLSTLTEALETASRTEEQWYEAELYRLKGELTLQSQVQGPKSKEEAAEECFQKAIETARKQQAKSLELRAVMSLARLWQRQGKQKDAHQMLSEIYGWFTEGFDTKDLQEAKALLEELAGEV
jgi:predicted ATPase